jgi:hypothetical protein
MDNTIAKNKQNNNVNIIDFGTRTISEQNQSKIVSLPKVALQNLGNITQVTVQLVHENNTKYIKLVPITRGGENN